MKTLKWMMLFMSVATMSLFTSCDKDDDKGDKETIDTYKGDLSIDGTMTIVIPGTTTPIVNPIGPENLPNQLIEVTKSSTTNKITVKNLTIPGMSSIGDVTIEDVVITPSSNGFDIQPDDFEITVIGSPATVTVNSGIIQNGILDLDLTITAMSGTANVNVTFTGEIQP